MNIGLVETRETIIALCLFQYLVLIGFFALARSLAKEKHKIEGYAAQGNHRYPLSYLEITVYYLPITFLYHLITKGSALNSTAQGIATLIVLQIVYGQVMVLLLNKVKRVGVGWYKKKIYRGEKG